ncbi:hypothetical protein BCR39DRAFT_517414 [Naematelia encephala]|uniref:HCP-like protein n=1 Tax=Naematelia encephala TaxID=71784 RepID=A0A1Y2BHL7_9TREE|nr:hypothetical protein BCR39DRAFT_517414 [Naematelia encephala]
MTSFTSSSYLRQPRMPSASDVVSSGSFASPLAQFKGSLVNSSSTSTLRHPINVKAVPTLDLNLFRTASVCSIDSLASLGTVSGESVSDFGSRVESPTTPRATKTHEEYFDLESPTTTPSKTSSSSQLTPKRSFRVASREPIKTRPRALSRPEPASRAPVPIQPNHDLLDSDLRSVHGEQGSEWGEDEANFEWLDTNDAPEAVNGHGRDSLSPSKRLSKIKASVPGLGTSEGRKLKKPLVFARRAPPPPSESGPSTSKAISHPQNLQPRSPRTNNEGSRAQMINYIEGPRSPRTDTEGPRSARTGYQGPRSPRINYNEGFRSPRTNLNEEFRTEYNDGLKSARTKHDEHLPAPGLRPPSLRSSSDPMHAPVPRRNLSLAARPAAQGSDRQAPIAFLPLKDSTSSAMNRRNSKMSMQSVAYSFYDLDPESPSTPRAGTPSGELLFPRGKYVKVPLSRLEHDARERTFSAPEPPRPTPKPQHSALIVGDRNADDLVSAGVEARGKGDLPKAAWYFMKAAEMGSATGRMYYGLALRHGWGVAKDDRKAFVELRRACEESLSGGQIDFHRSPGATKLTPQQKKAMTRDLSVGMFEIANCFLEGVGVKKAPDVGVSYLRFAANMGDVASQEQLGFLLSKGSGGIKKDMKEAARWYRTAIAQGSTNTFGLAWIWKDKYMD